MQFYIHRVSSYSYAPSVHTFISPILREGMWTFRSASVICILIQFLKESFVVICSSSGVSSGSSDTASNEDKNGGPHSPTPSSSSSQGTVKRSPNSGANSVVSSGTKVSSVVQARPRHLKQRKEVFKTGGGTPSINGK